MNNNSKTVEEFDLEYNFNKALSHLTKKQQFVIRAIVVQGKSVNEVAKELAVTASSISQIYGAACLKISQNAPTPKEAKKYVKKIFEEKKNEMTTPPNQHGTYDSVMKDLNDLKQSFSKPKKESVTSPVKENPPSNRPKRILEINFENDKDLLIELKAHAQGERRTVENQVLFIIQEYLEAWKNRQK